MQPNHIYCTSDLSSYCFFRRLYDKCQVFSAYKRTTKRRRLLALRNFLLLLCMSLTLRQRQHTGQKSDCFTLERAWALFFVYSAESSKLGIQNRHEKLDQFTPLAEKNKQHQTCFAYLDDPGTKNGQGMLQVRKPKETFKIRGKNPHKN